MVKPHKIVIHTKAMAEFRPLAAGGGTVSFATHADETTT